MEPESQSPSPTRRDLARRGLAFLAIFIVYQASEALQTVFKAGGAVGPALMLAALLLAWPAGRLIDRAPWRAYGLEWRRGAADAMAVGLALAFFAKLAALAAGLSVGAYGPAAAPPPGLSIAAVALAAFTTFVPSLVEDILTRGLLLRAPLRLTFWTYTFGSAAIYTLNHVWRFGWGPSETDPAFLPWAGLWRRGLAMEFAVGRRRPALGLEFRKRSHRPRPADRRARPCGGTLRVGRRAPRRAAHRRADADPR